MLAKVIIENGVKKIQALTADTGTGAPVGSYLYLEKKSNPQGYLYCDGSTFDETAYPALYQFLGTNVLPDWRELGAKGAEKNTTLIFDSTETDPSTGQAGTQNHDVFTQGEFKDDQLENHIHNTNANYDAASGFYFCTALGNTSAQSVSSGGVASARVGTVTRGKSRAVFIYIKATSGLTENQQENVLNTINENNSYSTEEHPTGKKWIDGKDIYSKVVVIDSNITNYMAIAEVPIDTIVSYSGMIIAQDGSMLPLPWVNANVNQSFSVYYVPTVNKLNVAFSMPAPTKIIVSIEYTKTTD